MQNILNFPPIVGPVHWCTDSVRQTSEIESGNIKTKSRKKYLKFFLTPTVIFECEAVSAAQSQRVRYGFTSAIGSVSGKYCTTLYYVTISRNFRVKVL